MEGPDIERSRNRAVFLDRDGTLVEDVGYLTSAQALRLLPGTSEALRRLKSAGFLLIVVTNQSAIARGLLTEQELVRIHGALQEMLRVEGAEIDDFFHCPHLPGGKVALYAVACSCRKPQPGLLLRAARKWGVDLKRSFAVGDSERDVEAGKGAGCRTVLISADPLTQTCADGVAPDLRRAADMIIRGLP